MDGTVGRYLSLLRQGLWGAGGRPSAGSVVPVGEKAGENLMAQPVGETMPLEGESAVLLEGESAVMPEGESVVRKVGEEEFAMGQQQSTTGLVIRFSEEERYQNELLFLRYKWHMHVAVLAEVKAKLDGAAIPFVLLKGLGCDHYYPEYGLRNLGDIDIYVGEENYGRAAEVLGCDAEASRSPKHFSVTVQDVTVEVHRACEILPSHRADRHFRRLAAAGLGSDLHTLNIGGVEVRTPQDDFNAIYLFVHFFDHFLGGGCGLRQVCDWALFLHARRDTLDRSYIAAALKGLGLANAWRTFGALAVRHLGLPAGSLPCSGLPDSGQSPLPKRQARRADRLLRVMLEMGNFGKIRKQERRRRFGTGFLSRKLGSLLGALHHSFEMLTLFPGHSLRGISHTLVNSTARSLRQLCSRV